MKFIQKTQPYIIQNDITSFYLQEDCIFFDIETTGFSPKTSQLYLIGCLYKRKNEIVIEHFFAESPEDEKEILESFLNLLKHFATIISFNGIGFDLPFIKAKYNSYGIFTSFSNDSANENFFDKFQYIDIFKEVSSIKFLLKLPNYKQKTIEHFLDIQRMDKFTGGELIYVYEDYVKTHDSKAEELLLLHNFEDILGMLDLLPILSYCKILNGAYEIKETDINTYTNYDGEIGSELILTLQNNSPVPKRVSHQSKDFYITMNQTATKIRVPIFEGELKFFYPNHKDYYYLPVEDMAIHKSVAAFVDKEYRQKAKASNCYTRKISRFLPQYDTIISPAFKKEHKDKYSYFELTDDFLSAEDKLQQYTKHIFCHLLKNK